MNHNPRVVLAKKRGAKITEARRLNAFTQEQLSEQLGVGVLAVSRYETGVILPPLDMLMKTAETLNTSVCAMLEEVEINKSSQHSILLNRLSKLPESEREWVETILGLLLKQCKTSNHPSD